MQQLLINDAVSNTSLERNIEYLYHQKIVWDPRVQGHVASMCGLSIGSERLMIVAKLSRKIVHKFIMPKSSDWTNNGVVRVFLGRVGSREELRIAEMLLLLTSPL